MLAKVNNQDKPLMLVKDIFRTKSEQNATTVTPDTRVDEAAGIMSHR